MLYGDLVVCCFPGPLNISGIPPPYSVGIFIKPRFYGGPEGTGETALISHRPRDSHRRKGHVSQGFQDSRGFREAGDPQGDQGFSVSASGVSGLSGILVGNTATTRSTTRAHMTFGAISLAGISAP